MQVVVWAASAILAAEVATAAALADSVPTHVRYATYYGQNGTYALDVPAKWMAAHVDFVQGNAAQCAAFHAAGGFKCWAYLRTTLQFRCPPNGAYGPCDDDIGHNLPESAWYHSGGPGSTRIYACKDALCWDEANPADSALRKAFQDKTSKLKAQGFDYAFCDDATALNFPKRAGTWWNFSDAPFEITGGQALNEANEAAFNTKWQHELAGLLNFGALPCWVASGAGPYFVSSTDSNIIGVSEEAGFIDPQHGIMGVGRKGGGRTWDVAQNNLLGAIQHGHGQYVSVLPESFDASTVVAERVYALASFWISYDPRVSVMFSFFASPLDAGGRSVLVYPEYQIVPRHPLQTAKDADILHSGLCATPSGPCYREFADCYQSTDRNEEPSRPRRIGHCAAVVNVSDHEVGLPALTREYSSSLVVDNRSTWSGGSATWTGPVPQRLPPLSAVVLKG
jgi:hypothetical protein